MGLFGPSKSELEERIDTLETLASDAENRARRAEDAADRAHKRANQAEKRARSEARTAVNIAHALNELHTADVGGLEDKRGVVEELDEPAIVWKATQDHVVKLLLPEGATVVHPDRGRNSIKKRTDEAIVLAFHNVEHERKRKRKRRRQPSIGTTTVRGVGSPSSSMGYEYETVEKVSDDPACTAKDYSKHQRGFTYNVGETVEPAGKLGTNTNTECTDGIHFFCEKEQALDWF